MIIPLSVKKCPQRIYFIMSRVKKCPAWDRNRRKGTVSVKIRKKRELRFLLILRYSYN